MKEKQMEVLMVEPGKYPYVTTIKNELEAMQKAVGGYIEAISLEDGNVIILNEEGKLMGLEGNRALGDDILVGPFLLQALMENTLYHFRKNIRNCMKNDFMNRNSLHRKKSKPPCSVDFLYLI